MIESNIDMTPDEKAEYLIEKTIRKVFLNLGIDMSNNEAVIEFQKDMHHARATRLREINSGNSARQHVVTMVLSGIAAAIVLGVAQFFRLNT